MIEIQRIQKNYKSRNNIVSALKNINLTLPSTGLVSIIGNSGTGKTTLINIIGGLDSEYGGNYKYINTDMNHNNDEKLSKFRLENISFIFQDISA